MFSAMPGQDITFDASSSYSPGSTIAKYDWDYNGDGTYEESTTTAVASRTYSAVFEGVMQVRMTDANGLVANASATVHIGKSPRDGLPTAPTNVTVVPASESGGISNVQVTWQSSDPLGWRFWPLAGPGTVSPRRRRFSVRSPVRRRFPRLRILWPLDPPLRPAKW